jgi:Leucine-rich repeat (LRR) protein
MDPGLSSVMEEWRNARAEVGWYGPNPKGFSSSDEKPNDDAYPAFWCEELDVDAIRELSTPSSPFALHFGGSDKMTEEMLTELARIPNLVALGLNHTNASDAGIKHLANLKSLESISISDTLVTDDGLTALAELPNLHTLYISNLEITDSGMEVLARITSLQHLDMCHTKVTDVGLKKLTALKDLKTLGVTGNDITDNGLAAITEVFPSLDIDR